MQLQSDELVRPHDVLDKDMVRNYNALLHLTSVKKGLRPFVRAHSLPRSPFLAVPRHIVDESIYQWKSATEDERQIALRKQTRDEEEAAEFERQWEEERRVKDLTESEEFLPSSEVCGRLGIKPGTLRQWANRGHVRVEEREIRTVRGWRDVLCYSLGDAARRKLAAGIELADRRAINEQDALRMLRVAVLECERTGVAPRVLQKYLIALAQGDRRDDLLLS